jgi:acyl-CoA thioester hydrolase
MRFHTKAHIRWDDLDAFNHVNNAKYLTYVQEARVALFWADRRAKGLPAIMDDMVVARAEVDYIKPIYDSAVEVDIAIWCSKIGRAAFDLQYEISSKKDGLYAKVKTVQVAVDMDTKRARSLRDEEITFLKEYFEENE